MTKRDALGREDWLKAGFRALTVEGPQALRVEALARGLKVSKGSFYWHFKDLPDLKKAMIEHWREVATFAVMVEVAEGATDARAQLLALVGYATGPATVDYGGPDVEAAIRAWGRSAPEIAAVIADVDVVRLGFVTQLFGAAGADVHQSEALGQMLYAALVGLEHLAAIPAEDRGSRLVGLLELLLDQIA